MPKYLTLDQHIVYGGATIGPNTPVNVPNEDIPIWEELVSLKVAERDEEDALEAEAALSEPRPEPAEGPSSDAESPPRKASPKKKSS